MTQKHYKPGLTNVQINLIRSTRERIINKLSAKIAASLYRSLV